jgi:hypothetical protein
MLAAARACFAWTAAPPDQQLAGLLAPGGRQRVLTDGRLRLRMVSVVTFPIVAGRVTRTSILAPGRSLRLLKLLVKSTLVAALLALRLKGQPLPRQRTCTVVPGTSPVTLSRVTRL